MVPRGAIACERPALHGDIEDGAWRKGSALSDRGHPRRGFRGACRAAVGRNPLASFYSGCLYVRFVAVVGLLSIVLGFIVGIDHAVHSGHAIGTIGAVLIGVGVGWAIVYILLRDEA